MMTTTCPPLRAWAFCLCRVLFLIIFCQASTPLFAAGDPLRPVFIAQEDQSLSDNFKKNPFVALPGLRALAPDPNQLQFQDLRGVECYAQPDRIEVCGAPDTLAFLLFTKSQEDLENISINVKFGEGLESSTFAFTPEPDGGGLGSESLDTISVQNPESPTFFLNEIKQADGAVVVYVGVRAECGADFEANPPSITYTFNYTAPGGIPCELVVTPEETYGGNVIVPKVEFNEGAAISNAVIRNSQAEFCQNVTFTQTTPTAQASGAIFTIDEYGQDAGVTFSSLQIGGQVLTASDYTVDPSTGVVTVPLIGDDNPAYFGGDGLINFAEDVVARVCYTLDGCVPNINIPTNYSVVSACDGELCTAPPDFISAQIDPAYNSGVDFARANIYRTISSPVVCGPDGNPTPYVFEVDITGRIDIDDPVDDALTDIRVNIQSCSPSPFGAPIFEIQTAPGVFTALDENVSNYLLEDQINANTGAVTNPAGTIILDFRQQRTDIGGGLTDVDGDTFFDDIAGGDLVTLRVTFPVSCSSEGAACSTPAPGDEICQFNRIRFDGRRRCDQAGQNETILLPGNPEFTTASTAIFSNGSTFNFPEAGSRTEFEGYNFGKIGVRQDYGSNDTPPSPKPAPTALPVSSQTIEITYTIGGGDLVQCPDTNPGTGQLSLSFQGDPRILQDAVISNITYDGNPVPAGDVTSTYSDEAGLTLLILEGDADAGTHTYSFDFALDTNYCSPPQLITVGAFIQSQCTNGCDCSATRACATTNFRVDPDDQCCLCIAEPDVQVNRISRGFTDPSRTTRVSPEDISEADNTRFLSGDTMEIVYSLVFNRNGDLTEINSVNRLYSFDVRLSANGGSNANVADYPMLFDYQLARLQVAEVRRDDGSIIKLGDIYSGPTQNRAQGLRVGFNDAVNNTIFPQDGEFFHPALPNGGYQFGAGNSGDDRFDGHVLRVEIGNLNGRQDALTPFREALGGGFRELDTFFMVWHVPVIDNPNVIGRTPNPSFRIHPVTSASNYIGPPANGVISNPAFACSPISKPFEYFSPKVDAESRIDYDGCDAEIVHKFFLDPTSLPTDWFANEWRPINGIERFVMDFPVPYYYNGGTTVEAVGLPAYNYEPDSTAGVDTALLTNGLTYYPDRGTIAGQLIFNDAELENGVRGDHYVDFDNGDDDITTVGGDWPLLAMGLGMTDSIVFRVPVSRLCGSSPTPGSALRMRYQAANKHLPDYDEFPYINNGNGTTRPYRYTNVPDPTASRYFPYDRLGGEFLNPHRQGLLSRTYEETNLPPEFVATASVGNGQLTDAPGATETNTYTLTPDPAQTLNGVVTITVDNSVALQSVSEGGASLAFNLVNSTDSNKIYSVEIPTKSAGEALSLEIETDLLFCDAGKVCVDALVPCGADPAPEVAGAFGVACGLLSRCYRYQGGVADLQISFAPSPSQDICTTRPLSISFTNNGSSIISDFSPIIFIPEGVEADETSFVATVMPGGMSMPLAGFANDPALDDVFGLGYAFPDGTLEALLGTDGLNPGETLTLDFMAETSCMITSGLPLAVDVDALLACGDMLDILPVLGPGINVNIPDEETPNFEFNVETPIQLSCGAEGTEILLTALQLGKVDAAETQICFRLPVGTRVEPTQIRPVSPEDFIVDPADIETTPIGTMGGEQVCFPAPSGLRNADFFCLNVPIFVDDLDCGERAIGVFLTQTTDVSCTGTDCEIDVLTSAMPYLPIEVTPPVSLITAELEAECTSTPGVFNVPYSATVEAPNEDFFGVGRVSLVFDRDGNGKFDSYDTEVGVAQTVPFNVPAGTEATFSGTFENIDQSQLCPLLLVVETDGCACTEKVLAFPATVPDFLSEVGDGITLCPGDDFVLTGICAPFNFALSPTTAGTITDNGDESITISLNPGFGVNTPVQLSAQGGFGNCTEDITIPVRQFEDFSFPDQTITVCNVGCQEVDLNIPASMEGDLRISVSPTTGVEDPNSTEPRFCDIQADTDYTVTYDLDNNGCTATSTISVVVFEQPTIMLAIEDGCSTGFSLTDNLTTNPPGLTGDFDSDGDGFFTPTKDIPGDVNYIPGPEDIKRGFVRIDFQTGDPDGPCGPALIRETFNLKVVDCGTYPWNGSND